jgi:hypothetical protein
MLKVTIGMKGCPDWGLFFGQDEGSVR